MRHAAARMKSSIPVKISVLAVCGLTVLSSGFGASAQTAPETLRIQVQPAEPGIRSISVNKKYRPIISRDDSGVVIDTLGSDNKPLPCDVKLEVTLENSRILHRDADFCSGTTLVVDVTSDGKPGAAARVVGTSSGVAAGPVTNNAPSTPTPSSSSTSTQNDQQQIADRPSTLETLDSPTAPGELKPLDRVDTPISAPDANGTDSAAISGNLESVIQDRLTQTGAPAVANPQAALVSPSDLRQWNAEPGNQPGTLSVLQHTVPQTDDRDFHAQCGTQSGFALVTFQQAPAGLIEGMPQGVRITAGEFSGFYNAFGSSNNNEAGLSLPEITLEMTDPLWEALIRQSELSITVEGMPTYSVSLNGSANPVRLFNATCAMPQQIISDGSLSGEEPSSDLACSEIGRVRSVEAIRPGQIVFRNASQSSVEIHWIDYKGGERPYARLEPGQILEQQTYVSHAWSVRGANGQCRGIYVTKTPYREVVINGPAGSRPGGFGEPLGQGNFPGTVPNGQFPAGPVPPGNVGGATQQTFGQQTAGTNIADYLCTAGIDLNVIFSADGRSATIAEMGYGTVTLQRQGSANTFYFEAQGHVLKGQLQNATWSRPGLRDVFCAKR
ncbi:MAG: hypothetical protein ABJL55_05030 [Roseibium sp.]